MKRILSVLLILIAVLSVCACDAGKENDTTEKGGNTNTYTGTVNGDKATVTLGGDKATVKITKSYRQSGLDHTYVYTLTAPFTKDGDRMTLDIEAESATVLVKFTLAGDELTRTTYIETLKGLSYNRDPLYLDFCDGTEVEITSESTVWSAAGVGIYEGLTLKLKDNGTFQWVTD